MIIYQSDAIGFRNEVDNNSIVPKIEKQFIRKYGRKVNDQEKMSWNNSLRFMETVIRRSEIADDCGVLIEYNIPTTGKRIDFLISGHDEEHKANFVIVELKQWDKAYSTDKEAIVKAFVGGAVREVTHPSYQSYSYKKYLSDMNESVYSSKIKPFSCSYLHNYIRKKPEPLLEEQYQEIVNDTPVFFSEDVKKLGAFIKKYVGKGKGYEILYTIEHGKIRPSKKFIDYVADIFDGNEVYTLLDEQKIAYSNIIKYATSATRKTTIIVNGGPGTGKSVVAMNAFVELLKRNKNIKFIAPNAAFRDAMVDMLSNNRRNSKSRLKVLFSGSSSYYNTQKDQFDVLLVDEAHRLKKKGAFMYKGESQIEDVIHSSFVNVFFIDDNQRIRPNDEGSVSGIVKAANKYNSDVVFVELKAQFRCAGAEGFINWLDHNLQIEDTANFDGWDDNEFDFKIVDDPNSLLEKIKEKSRNGYKARLLAGYAWPWTKEREGNPNGDVDDVRIPEFNFYMPWNSRSNSTTWAIDPDKENQIGCVHTSQGLEFDYIGVIIGNDLRYNPDTMKIYASYDDYFDSKGKTGLKNDPEELSRLIKNIYKILMSRGMKGCYVFCRDQNLQKYLKDRLTLAQI